MLKKVIVFFVIISIISIGSVLIYLRYQDNAEKKNNIFVMGDNQLIYSTFLGGFDDEYIGDIICDEDDNIYIVGTTRSDDFPTTIGVYNTEYNGGLSDIFVCKFNTVSSSLIFSTFIGGSNKDEAISIKLDSDGNIIVSGNTNSTDFPLSENAIDRHLNNDNNIDYSDIFLSKLDSTGSSLLFSTYLGGTYGEKVKDMAIDTNDDIYLTGYSNSNDFPVTSGAFDQENSRTPNGELDTSGFVCKLNMDNMSMIYSTYLGGAEHIDKGLGIDIDKDGNAVIVGQTYSVDFPYTHRLTDALNWNSTRWPYAFICKLNYNGSNLLYSYILGGQGRERALDVIVDEFGNAYSTGYTSSNNFPITDDNIKSSDGSSGDIFLVKINDDGSSLLFSILIGGSSYDVGNSITKDNIGNIYIGGISDSIDFPTSQNAYDSTMNSEGEYANDIFLCKINISTLSLEYSTLLGGIDFDYCESITIDSFGNIIIIGTTRSENFPTTINAYDTSYNGGSYLGSDAYFIIFNIPEPENNNNKFIDNGIYLFFTIFILIIIIILIWKYKRNRHR